MRLYSEEKDRNVLVCVDQRSQMFFSSQVLMKSVVAAEIAALIGWRVLKDNDRIGFLIASPQRFAHFSAKRSQPHLMRALQQLTDTNQSLNAHSQNAVQVRFSHLTDTLARLRPQSWTIILISDWHDATEADLRQLQYLQRNNNVLGIFVTDPLEASLPQSLHQHAWVVGEGTHQLSLDSAGKVSAASASLSRRAHQTRQQLTHLMALNEMPLVELDTTGQHLQTFQQAIGGYR
ncbi:DUF58 domain-containing protein [Photobacterium sp. TY1-4]|uniref:DUF58 domain-containing protein n=1 Tax=Photobacterium sp. TY1-4 TaxID=2899122 RepID=UPI0021BFE53E|nr:DUF58 domain-containing protein [Photobacterium sp. TY1-4]UXI04547.1 DUF58 domain-containing protein [Photobacterium sp. TY1-4]